MLVNGELGRIVRALPSTVTGIDGVSSRMVRHVWKVAQSEVTRVYMRCVEEGVFPRVWKSGRLLVIPKGNGKPATDPKAYSPITLLSVLGKILKRILLKLASELISCISPCQHDYMTGLTVTALGSD
ncbi:Putative 115 kDa protein in type-1 retrotransposable element R1DM [Eumeta japonica]|uniref:115 kDa protein in type-1 retrotransposable element R1DM n=1 Tax=Eumeta variegata TaxID=151549 RepID=A0A4C1Y8J7_EUMVA|nr:Putative 115 kDa protein in type-1 retrotransposable element R1DM [Eumeta japonica]